VTISIERLAQLESMVLLGGAHPDDDGKCAMEAVAWLANEPHSDAPSCTCRVIASFVRRLNDRISDDETRTRLLRPLIRTLIGTVGDRRVMIKRGYIAADFAVRVAAPIALESRGRTVDADTLRALDPIIDRETALKARAAAAYAADADAAAYAAYAAAAAAAAGAAAGAAAYAAYAAYAADDAAYAAAADAAAYAAYAAYAAAAAYAADADAAARVKVYELAVDCITRMIEVRS
jgi:hypothetical protein